jgi:hypothetical protein
MTTNGDARRTTTSTATTTGSEKVHTRTAVKALLIGSRAVSRKSGKVVLLSMGKTKSSHHRALIAIFERCCCQLFVVVRSGL